MPNTSCPYSALVKQEVYSLNKFGCLVTIASNHFQILVYFYSVFGIWLLLATKILT